jgi:hypothetical protein
MGSPAAQRGFRGGNGGQGRHGVKEKVLSASMGCGEGGLKLPPKLTARWQSNPGPSVSHRTRPAGRLDRPIFAEKISAAAQ